MHACLPLQAWARSHGEPVPAVRHCTACRIVCCGVCSNFAWKDRASEKWDYQGIVVQHPSKEAAPGAHFNSGYCASMCLPQLS
jgi:hypothetical protein